MQSNPFNHENKLSSAEQELEIALGELTPANIAMQRDQLMFAAGRKAGRRSAMRTVGSVMVIALAVNISFLWFMQNEPEQSVHVASDGKAVEEIKQVETPPPHVDEMDSKWVLVANAEQVEPPIPSKFWGRWFKIDLSQSDYFKTLNALVRGDESVLKVTHTSRPRSNDDPLQNWRQSLYPDTGSAPSKIQWMNLLQNRS